MCESPYGLVAFGRGGAATGAATHDRPATLVVRDCLVERSREVGVNVTSSVVTVERTIVRDTDARLLDGNYGMGMQAVVFDGDPWRSTLIVADSLVANHRLAGIIHGASDVTLQRTIVSDTRPELSDGLGGWGIFGTATDWHDVPFAPSTVQISDGLVSGNRTAGVFFWTATGTVERTIVRDTLPMASGLGGAGIFATMNPARKLGSTVDVRECIVARSRLVGIDVAGGKATLERTAVRDTLPQADGFGGVGVAVVPHESGAPSTLALRDCLVERSKGVGLYVVGSAATVQRTVVRDTRTGQDAPARQGFGDGIEVAGKASLALEDSLVELSPRLGVLVVESAGAVRRSVLRKGVLAIAVEGACEVEIGDDNVYEGNVENRVTYGNNLKPSPPPKAPPVP